MPKSRYPISAKLAEARTHLNDRFEAELLLCHVLKRDRSWLMAHATDAIDSDHAAQYDALVERRRDGEPVAYIMGVRGFWKMDLAVSPAVLIPRPETELLVEQALERLPPGQACTVADLGTGSGAVALAIASERRRAEVTATDASEDALAVARANAERLGLDTLVFVQGDWWQPLAGRRFDIIVSNPPYIAADDHHLGQGDLRHEPLVALASGSDGLDAIRQIVAGAAAHLDAGGWLLLEHGWNQGAAVRALLEQAGFDQIFSARDLQQHERVSGGRKPQSDQVVAR